MQLNRGMGNESYDAYIIHNKPGEKIQIPEGYRGAIGITVDDKIQGVLHAGLKVFNNVSTARSDIEPIDKHFGVDLTNMMHAFVVTEHNEDTHLEVCEAVGSGFTKAKIAIGDQDWTAMILFVPKDAKVREQIVKSSEHELKPDVPGGKTAPYGFVAGVVSVFTRKQVLSSAANKEVIASEMADLIKERSIRNKSGDPKEAVCSQLATRVLRASILISKLPEAKVRKYSVLDKAAIEEKLIKKMTITDSPLTKAYWSSKVFDMQASEDALPYELYQTLIKESTIQKVAPPLPPRKSAEVKAEAPSLPPRKQAAQNE